MINFQTRILSRSLGTMKYYSTSVLLQAPQEAAWAFITDIHRHPEWERDVQTVLSVAEGPVGVDTVYRERMRIIGPFHAEGEWRITQFKPPSVHERRGTVPITGVTTVRYMLEPAEDGCLCTVQIYYEPGAGIFGKLIDVLFVGPRISRSLRRDLRWMKKLAEKREAEG